MRKIGSAMVFLVMWAVSYYLLVAMFEFFGWVGLVGLFVVFLFLVMVVGAASSRSRLRLEREREMRKG